MTPFFSVVIPTYNRAHTIKRAVFSVLQQDYQNFDLWIVDDGTVDETKKIISAAQSLHPHRINYLKTPRRGVSAARNLGVAQSEGDWIAFLDSDDEWKKNKLSLQANFIQENPHIQLVHGEEIWMKNHQRINPRKKHQKHGGFIFQKCLALCLISPSTVVLKRELFEKTGGFNPDFPVCEDYDLWLRITREYETGFIEKPVTIKHGGHPDQLSKKYKAMDYWRVLSLFNILKSENLSEEDRKAVCKQIMLKTEILLNGYRKHHNMKNHHQIEKIRNEIQPMSQ
ncbi:MAG: glycosyltransferase family A protein [Halobacteriovoraceae bacterium]|nr:glycosyltransferase family A protein [Halobacteriovoraceae bacterium]